jgi:hypothetical protein
VLSFPALGTVPDPGRPLTPERFVQVLHVRWFRPQVRYAYALGKETVPDTVFPLKDRSALLTCYLRLMR